MPDALTKLLVIAVSALVVVVPAAGRSFEVADGTWMDTARFQLFGGAVLEALIVAGAVLGLLTWRKGSGRVGELIAIGILASVISLGVGWGAVYVSPLLAFPAILVTAAVVVSAGGRVVRHV